MTDTATAPSAAVEVFQTGDLDPTVARHLAAQWREAQRLAMTSVVPKSITHRREKVGNRWEHVEQPPAVIAATVFAVVRYGELFEFPPAVALGKIDVIEGRLEPRYDAIAGLMMDAGHQVRLREVSAELATVAVRRREDRDDATAWQLASFTAAEAHAAGYIKDNPEDYERKSAWYTRRADMLMSKAIKRACRWFTPDVFIRREAVELVDGVEVAAIQPPTAEVDTTVHVGADGSAASPSMTVEAPFPDDDTVVDGEVVNEQNSEGDAGDREAPDQADATGPGTTSAPDTTDEAAEHRAKLQRQLMATATKTFPKAEGLTTAAAKARQTGQRHAIVYVALGFFKSANDMTAEELLRVISRLDDVREGRLALDEVDGQWVARQGDRSITIPTEPAS
jgi:hypothetical protein